MSDEKGRLTQYTKGGGCGCKIAPSVLQQIIGTTENPFFKDLLVGNDKNDDAAVYALDGKTGIISTADFFVPIVDDAFDFGRIAAANAISDVYAMGGTPLMAIALLGWPIDKLPVDDAQRVLEGGRTICREAGIPLAGGHTIDSADPIFGLSVTGTVSIPHLKKNSGAREGDLLFLTKPIGSGIMATALKRGLLSEEHYTTLLAHLTALNKVGLHLGKIEGVHALTDVTGFGLLGHLLEMCEGSGVGATLYYEGITKMEGLDSYLQQRTIPDATFRNWNSYSAKVGFEKGVNVMEAFNLLPDPQTNGGLLIAASPESAEEVKTLFKSQNLEEFINPIGICTAPAEKTIRVQLAP
jgi:selenide,water dikinase